MVTSKRNLAQEIQSYSAIMYSSSCVIICWKTILLLGVTEWFIGFMTDANSGRKDREVSATQNGAVQSVSFQLRSCFQKRISKYMYCNNWWPRETYKTACKLWFVPYQSTNTMDYDIVKCTKMRVFIMQFSFIGKLSWFIDINGEERDQNKLFISRFLNIHCIHQNVYQLTIFGIFLTKIEHQIWI